MYFQQIINLLSNHRQSDRPELPTTLSKTQIVASIAASISPNNSPDNIGMTITENLGELTAQGEINAGNRNRYCIAPPTVLVPAENNLTELLFQGDRAYLALAHDVLNTKQKPDKIKIKPNVNNFQSIKNQLNRVGVSFLTIDCSIESLPLPKLPTKVILRSSYTSNPFDNQVLQYNPQNNFHQQIERWQEIRQHQLTNKSLLQLATKEYLWFENKQFYELERDKAILAMYEIDRKTEHPLQIPWDESEGQLHLKNIQLPHTYAKWLWSLSQPVTNTYRTRQIKPEHHNLIQSAFNRLGCLLV